MRIVMVSEYWGNGDLSKWELASKENKKRISDQMKSRTNKWTEKRRDLHENMNRDIARSIIYSVPSLRLLFIFHCGSIFRYDFLLVVEVKIRHQLIFRWDSKKNSVNEFWIRLTIFYLSVVQVFRFSKRLFKLAVLS